MNKPTGEFTFADENLSVVVDRVHFVFGDPPVPEPRLGEDQARLRSVVVQLATEMLHEDPQPPAIGGVLGVEDLLEQLLRG